MVATVGKAIRLGRLLPGSGQRAACFAFDHGLQAGPIPGARDLRAGVALAVEAGFDAIILGPSAIERCCDLLTGRDRPAIIMRVDQTSMWRNGSATGYPEGHTRQVAGVDEAARMGADAVLSFLFTTHVSPELESRSIEIAAATAREARRLGLVYVAEPMAARGGLMPSPFETGIVAMNARIAAEIGADVLKIDWPGSKQGCAEVVASSAGAPVLVAGGERSGNDEETLCLVADLLTAGAKGVMFGRALFQSPDPLVLMRRVRAMIHEGLSLKQAVGGKPARRRRKTPAVA